MEKSQIPVWHIFIVFDIEITLNIFIYLELPDALHYLPMDEIDDNAILGTINGTLKNGPRLVEGVVGKALHFNGNSQSAAFGLLP